MKRSLMTSAEFDERSPKTYREALTISIEKWTRARDKRNWPKLRGFHWRGAVKHYNWELFLSGGTCGLCYWFESTCAVNRQSCPLGSCDRGGDWEQAAGATVVGDRELFLTASGRLLATMRDALEKFDKQDNEKRAP